MAHAADLEFHMESRAPFGSAGVPCSAFVEIKDIAVDINCLSSGFVYLPYNNSEIACSEGSILFSLGDASNLTNSARSTS